MKKVYSAIFFVVLLVLVGCQKKAVVQQVPVPAQNTEVKEKSKRPKIDLDMTKLNYNMVSSLIFNMMVESEKYLGKRIKIAGKFYSEFDEDNLIRHYSVLIWDNTACCQVGLQFIREGDYEFPKDYPEQMTPVEISGIYSIKEINGMDYVYLACDDFKIMENK